MLKRWRTSLASLWSSWEAAAAVSLSMASGTEAMAARGKALAFGFFIGGWRLDLAGMTAAFVPEAPDDADDASIGR